MHKTHTKWEVLSWMSAYMLCLSSHLLLVFVLLKWHCVSYHQDFNEKGMKEKKYYRISYINRSLISNTDFQMHNLEWVITLSRLLHPDLKYWWKGVIAIPITHVQMRHFTCPVKWSISIQQKNIVEVLQGNVAEKIGLSLAESYFSPLPNEAIHITLHRFKLTWNWTKTAKVLARALFCWPYCKQQCPVGQPVRNSL